jgi:ribonuclease HI
MEKVDIYIDVYHTGHLKKGTGTYGIVLEYVTAGGVPKTREYTGGVKNTSLNRTALYSCIASLGHLIRPCEVQVHINSEYIVRAVSGNLSSGWKPE